MMMKVWGDYYERVLGKTAGREIIKYKIEPICIAWGWPPYETSKIALLSWLAQKRAVCQPPGWHWRIDPQTGFPPAGAK